MAEPLIFTSQLHAAASKSPPHSAPLMHRWARRSGVRGDRLREQIERAAALVPPQQRASVLGALLAKSASDDQVRAATGSLLLGKMLMDQGWSVEFEPEEAGGTPDFRIIKGESEFLLEVRRVATPRMSPSERDIARVRDALAGIETRTPIGIRAITIAPNRSLKRFKAHMKRLLSGTPSPGKQSFQEDGVYIGFDVHRPFDDPMPAIFGWTYSPIYGGQHEPARAHINEKLVKYKVPLIVALDFHDFHDAFTTVEEVLFGKEVIQIPIDLSGRGESGEPRPGRADDGILVHRGADGARARSRLQAVLAFGLLGADEDGFEIRARIIGNPAAEEPLRFPEFAPIPRLVVVEETATERRMRCLDARDRSLSNEQMARWKHIP